MSKKEAIIEIIKSRATTQEDLMRQKRKISKKFKISLPQNSEILKVYKELLKSKKIKKNLDFEEAIMKRAVRTLSGIAPVAVLTKPWPCPGKCAYCPSEKDVPQSYLSNEPAVMRAIRCNYNPYVQTQDRLRALENNGHNPTKIELIVIGGTWSYLPTNYKYWYIKEVFRAANDYFRKSNSKTCKETSSLKKLKANLNKEQKRNENTKYQIIGLTLETRPDYITHEELIEMREFGCTRVEIGVQAIDDDILSLNKRGHNVSSIIKATSLLKNYGLKVTYHLMPGLPGSTPKKDLKMFRELFSNQDFQPDQIKFYPTVVTKGSLLYRWWKDGKYSPYSDKILQKLIIDCKKNVPRYVRIIRLIRDIPGESIIAGNLITNLRQIMKDQGVKCNCIRCREIKEKTSNLKEAHLKIIHYNSSEGIEYFLSYITKEDQLLAFLRLYLPSRNFKSKIKTIQSSAIIRELHVYGQLVSRGNAKRTQHSGLGKKLIKKAEEISIVNNYQKISIISGVGVRNYYRKLKYRLSETYLVKNIL